MNVRKREQDVQLRTFLLSLSVTGAVESFVLGVVGNGMRGPNKLVVQIFIAASGSACLPMDTPGPFSAIAYSPINQAVTTSNRKSKALRAAIEVYGTVGTET